MARREPWRLLVFGATGSIGSCVVDEALAAGWRVVAAARGAPPPVLCADGLRRIAYDPLNGDAAVALAGEAPFDAVCWAHGVNAADTLAGFDAALHAEMYRANCLSIMVSASALLDGGFLSPAGARLTVVSSIWQDRARQNKLSYIVTKAAVGGLVRSAAVDLGPAGHLINAVLPGVLETPMTEANLSAQQIEIIRSKIPAGRLPDLATVADTVLFLCSRRNRSISGQSVTVDLGMSNAHLV